MISLFRCFVVRFQSSEFVVVIVVYKLHMTPYSLEENSLVKGFVFLKTIH